MPSFQIASDLHLEFYQEEKLVFQTLIEPTGADYLLLAGDIGYPELSVTQDFFKWCCSNWKHVVWIFGNHEYYSTRKMPLTMDEKEEAGKSLAGKFENLHLLFSGAKRANEKALADESESSFHIPGTDLVLFGSTFWTSVSESSKGSKYMNDFHLIYQEKGIPLTVQHYNALHDLALESLKKEIARVKGEGKRLLVMTHHLPSYSCVDEQYKDHPLNEFFATKDADELLEDPSVALWVCGHSHSQLKKGKCILNARGYPREDSVQGYSPSLLIHL